MVENGDDLIYVIVPAHLDPQGPLPDGRRHDLRGDVLGGPILPAHSLEARCRHDDPVEVLPLDLFDPRVQVSPDGNDFDVHVNVFQL